MASLGLEALLNVRVLACHCSIYAYSKNKDDKTDGGKREPELKPKPWHAVTS
jgi:hypothetical protein